MDRALRAAGGGLEQLLSQLDPAHWAGPPHSPAGAAESPRSTTPPAPVRRSVSALSSPRRSPPLPLPNIPPVAVRGPRSPRPAVVVSLSVRLFAF